MNHPIKQPEVILQHTDDSIAEAERIPFSTRWAWLIPSVLALFYPSMLAKSHQEFAAHGSTLLAWALLGAACLVPVTGLVCAYRLRMQANPWARQLLALRLAHLAVATPPVFTLVGVLLYLMRINDLDGAVWTGIWAIVALAGVILTVTASPELPRHDVRAHRRLRTVHGVAALVVLMVFLAPHLANHASALWGAATHTAVMQGLRLVYRQGWIEAAIVALFFFQIVSGAVLLRHKTSSSRDWLDTLQTASGVFLMAFIAAHINSVFTLARRSGTETDFAWATGAPTGLLLDPWSIRLVPHYCLAVFFLGAHLASALRTILVAHGASKERAHALASACVVASAGLALLITGAMLGLRLNDAP